MTVLFFPRWVNGLPGVFTVLPVKRYIDESSSINVYLIFTVLLSMCTQLLMFLISYLPIKGVLMEANMKCFPIYSFDSRQAELAIDMNQP